jgi:hypothetical protein
MYNKYIYALKHHFSNFQIKGTRILKKYNIFNYILFSYISLKLQKGIN